MSTTEQRLTANRANAQLSTGPSTFQGKATASKNATRHGLLSSQLFLEDEDPSEFQALLTDLSCSLNPIDALERTLIERIAVAIWRQRRLVHAETAALRLSRQPLPVAKAVSSELGRGYGSEIKPDEIQPFDGEREAWCRSTLAEIEALEEIDLRSFEQSAPLTYAQLLDDAEGMTPEDFLAAHQGGLTGYLGELTLWCRMELREAEARPHLLGIAEQVRVRRIVLPTDTLEVLSRYQTTLDNQLYKALKAFREAQEWRSKTLEAMPIDAEAFRHRNAQDAA